MKNKTIIIVFKKWPSTERLNAHLAKTLNVCIAIMHDALVLC